MTRRARLAHLDVLQYALEGACMRRGLYSGAMSDAEEEQIDADIAELQRRIKLAELAQARKGEPS